MASIVQTPLSIVLWELFKRLVAPNTLTRLINKHGEARVMEMLAERVSEREMLAERVSERGRLVAPNTLTRLINKHGEARVMEMLAERVSESGEAGIRAAAAEADMPEDSKLNGEWSPSLNSSNIDAIRWLNGNDSTGTMEVRFLGGAVYQYYDVPQSVFLDFYDAPSKGKWFWQNIRGGNAKTSNYSYAKIASGTVTGAQRRTEASGYAATHRKVRR
jgi:hypothetical protein